MNIFFRIKPKKKFMKSTKVSFDFNALFYPHEIKLTAYISPLFTGCSCMLKIEASPQGGWEL